MILTLDLGTSVTKAALWEEAGLCSIGRSPLVTVHGDGGRAEQDPDQWWESVKLAVARALSGMPEDRAGTQVEAIGFSAARQTFVPVDSEMHPLGMGILWSDRRATEEAASLARLFGDPEQVHMRTGLYMDAGGVAPKIAWLFGREPGRAKVTGKLVSPKDLVAWKLTGELATDTASASATGLYEVDGPAGVLVSEISEALGGESKLAELLPPPLEPSSVMGRLLPAPASELGLPAGVPVVVGAGDRACEVLGAGASVKLPMVSWGTTANTSVPTPRLLLPLPKGLVVTRSAESKWLLEGGLSAAGSLLEWLSGLWGTDVASSVNRANGSPPGSRGVLVMPWLGGARAPWWCAGAGATILGLNPEHDVGDVTRAAVEGVALDLLRCLESAYGTQPGELAGPQGLVLGGGGAASGLWTEVLTGTTALGASRRSSGEAACAGAALLVGRATGLELELDKMDPLSSQAAPDPTDVDLYRSIRPRAERAARSVLETVAFG